MFLKSIIDTVRKQRKWNHIKHPIKITKGRKIVEEKNKEQRQKVENNSKYRRY